MRYGRVYYFLNAGFVFWGLALVLWSLPARYPALASGGLASALFLLHGIQQQVFIMFGKNKMSVTVTENRIITAPLVPAEKEVSDEGKHNNTVISAEVCFEGNIATAGQIYIYGEVLGNINAPGGLIKVMRHGRVQGNITSRELIIDGQVLGECHSDIIDIYEHGHVEGTLVYYSLSVKKGGGFTGQAEKIAEPEPEIKLKECGIGTGLALVTDEKEKQSEVGVNEEDVVK